MVPLSVGLVCVTPSQLVSRISCGITTDISDDMGTTFICKYNIYYIDLIFQLASFGGIQFCDRILRKKNTETQMLILFLSHLLCRGDSI